MNKGYKGNNGISKAQVIELIVEEVAKIQTGGLDLSTYAKKSEVSTQISNAIKNFLTEEEVQALLEALDIPTKISELQNDLNLVNKSYVDNAINAKKHYTEEEIKTIIERVLEEKEVTGTVDEEAVQTIINTSLSQLNIPTKTSQLTNDSNFITGSEVSTQISNAVENFLTEEEIQTLLGALDIPTKISELQNDSNLVNETYVNNAINAKKHYTEEEIKTIVEGVLEEKEIGGTIDEEAVQTIINESLSQLNIPTKTSQLTNDSDFITGSEVDSKIANVSLGGEVDLTSYAKKSELADKVDKVDGKSLVEDSVIEATKVLIGEEKLEYIIKIDNSLSSVELTKSIQQQFDEAYELGCRRVTFPKNTEIEVIDELDGVGDTALGFREKPILNLHPSTIYDLNDATIKIKKNNYAGYSIFTMENISNTTLKNGRLIGDKSEHTFVNFTNPLNNSHEWGLGVHIEGAKYCNVENLTFSEFTGDGMYMGMLMCTAKTVRSDGIESGTISTSTGEIEEGEGFRTSSFLKIKQGTVNTSRPFEYKTLFIFPNNSTGYGQAGKYSKKWITIFFYKEDETFIKSERIHISNPVAIPEEADSFKVALPYDAEWSTEDLNERGFCARIGELSENTNIKQCVITNCRRNGLSISGSRYCSITDCKITNIKGTAPQACIDVEDTGLVSQGIVIQNCEFAEGLVGVTFYDGSSHILKDSGFYNIQYPFGSTYSQNCTIKNCVAIINNGKAGHVEFNQTVTPKPLAPIHTIVDNIKLVGISSVAFKEGAEARNVLLEDCARLVVDNCRIDNLTIVQKEVNILSQGYNIQNNSIVENLKATGKFGRINLKNASINHGDLSLTTQTFIAIIDGVMREVIVPKIALTCNAESLSLIKDCIIGTNESALIQIEGGAYINKSTFKFEGCKLICGGGTTSVYGIIPLYENTRLVIKNCELYNYNQNYAFLTGYGNKGDLVMTDSILVNKRESFNNFKIVSNYLDNNIVLGDNEFINVVQPPIDTKIIDEDNVWRFEE